MSEYTFKQNTKLNNLYNKSNFLFKFQVLTPQIIHSVYTVLNENNVLATKKKYVVAFKMIRTKRK